MTPSKIDILDLEMRTHFLPLIQKTFANVNVDEVNELRSEGSFLVVNSTVEELYQLEDVAYYLFRQVNLPSILFDFVEDEVKNDVLTMINNHIENWKEKGDPIPVVLILENAKDKQVRYAVVGVSNAVRSTR